MSTATHPSLLIPRVAVLFGVDGRNEPVELHTENAVDVFAALEAAAEEDVPVLGLEIDGRPIDADSLAALNAYLRTPRALNWNGVLPFSRIVRDRSRWSWQMFLAYLDVTFDA